MNKINNFFRSECFRDFLYITFFIYFVTLAPTYFVDRYNINIFNDDI